MMLQGAIWYVNMLVGACEEEKIESHRWRPPSRILGIPCSHHSSVSVCFVCDCMRSCCVIAVYGVFTSCVLFLFVLTVSRCGNVTVWLYIFNKCV